ncbi:hypothetical protein VNO77_18225 [Canavalia gladiata]|uniref:BHLH domain-containing protein n=1 Tax=Canavalia gladiata TaxID=3824 RepID=A0AAN9QK49_CANGL
MRVCGSLAEEECGSMLKETVGFVQDFAYWRASFIMSLPELYYCMPKGKLDPKEMNNTCVTDQSSLHKNDLVELVWNNGEISVQDQSSRARRSPTCKTLPSHCLPSHTLKSKDKQVGYNTRMGKYVNLDGEVDLRGQQNQDEMMPWLNYVTDDPFQHEYSSDFHQLSGVAMNHLSVSNNFTLLDRKNNCNKALWDIYKHPSCNVLSSEQGILSKGSSAGDIDTSRPKVSTTGQLLYPPPSMRQSQTSFASSVTSTISDIDENKTNNATQHAPCGEITQIPFASSGFSSLKVERQGPMMSSNGSTMMTFSHFAKPAAIVEANLKSIGLTSRSASVGIKKKGAAATARNPAESTKLDLSGECDQVVEPSKVDLKQSVEQDAAVSTKSDPCCKEDASKIDQTSNLVVGESGRKEKEGVEKSMEPAVVSSSVCSGNGSERSSHHPNQSLTTKSRDTEDFEGHSEVNDVEEESVGVKKEASARRVGSKRSRSSEVHNLSERRRRDRINEKMRTLQELIPNCNKADKASMLDEAIEYLKTLQLQLQIMSMGTSLYMPTMMVPSGMQHMHAPHISPFSPTGVSMQMGLGVGCGMGMADVNDGSSSTFSMIKVPQMQGTQLPVTHTLGSTALCGMARSNPQVFGFPGQGLPPMSMPMPMPHAPMFSFSGEPLMNPSALGPNACETTGLIKTLDSASASGLKDQMPNMNSQLVQNTNACNSTNHMPTQCEATIGGFEHSTSVLNNGHASSANDTGAVNHGKEDSLVIDKSSNCH